MAKQYYELPNLHSQLLSMRIQAWATTMAGGMLLGAGLGLPNLSATWRLAVSSTGVVCIAASGSSQKREDELVQQIADLGDISAAEASYSWFSWLRGQTPNPSQLNGQLELAGNGPKAAYPTFNMDNLTTSPHWAILGSTGSGKSIFLHYLIDTFLVGQAKLILDPHADPAKCLKVGSATEATEVIRKLTEGELDSVTIGGGRDYSQISLMVDALYLEMDRRYASGKAESWRTINCIVDEAVSVALNDASKDSWKANQVAFLTEARKSNIRLVLLLQTALVKAMGLEGNSELRNAYLWVRIGNFALKHANQLKNEPLVSQLERDIKQSLKDHKASGSTALYTGSCYLADDEYIPYRNLGFYYQLRGMSEPTLEDLRESAFGQLLASPEPTNEQPEANQQLANQVLELTNLVAELQAQLAELADSSPPPSTLLRQQRAALVAETAPNLVPEIVPNDNPESTYKLPEKALAESAFDSLMATCISKPEPIEPPEVLISEALTSRPVKVNFSQPSVELDSETFKVLAGYAEQSGFTLANYQAYLDNRQAGLSHTKSLNKLGYKSGARFQSAARLVKTLAEYQLESANQVPEGLLLDN